jgi:hypothetical protein
MFNAPARMLRWTGYREPIRANYCQLPPPVPAELDGKPMTNDQGPASLEREPGL